MAPWQLVPLAPARTEDLETQLSGYEVVLSPQLLKEQAVVMVMEGALLLVGGIQYEADFFLNEFRRGF
jgi:hypothetical protein